MLTAKGQVWKIKQDKSGAGNLFYKVQILQDLGEEGAIETIYYYGAKQKPHFPNKNVEISVEPRIMGRDIRLVPFGTTGFEEEQEKEPEQKDKK